MVGSHVGADVPLNDRNIVPRRWDHSKNVRRPLGRCAQFVLALAPWSRVLKHPSFNASVQRGVVEMPVQKSRAAHRELAREFLTPEQTADLLTI